MTDHGWGDRMKILVPVLAVLALIAPAAQSADESTPELNGFFSSYFEWRRGDNSSNVRQDQDVFTDLDLHYGPRNKDWSVDLSVRGSADIDGRRISPEPEIYGGIYETFVDNLQPWLYRASFSRRFDRSVGKANLTAIEIGRQYELDGDFLWFDGIDLEGSIPVTGMDDVTFAVFGGVPVRFFESASDDWLAGGRLAVVKNSTRFALEAYHIDDKQRYGWTRRDNVVRGALSTMLADQLSFGAVVKAIDDEEIEGDVRFGYSLDNGVRASVFYRFQSEDRGPSSTELDAMTFVLGRSQLVSRRAYNQYGGDVTVPLTDRAAFAFGASAFETEGPVDANNMNFDRYYASLDFAEIPVANLKFDVGITAEAYETPQDWTRAISGEIAANLTENFRVSGGTSFALYRYDYILNTVRDEVRIGTVKAEWKATQALKFEARYDIEDDDYRLHHFARAGFRYDF